MPVMVRSVTFVMALLLGRAGACTFECSGVKRPSNLVICCDPELMSLADERREAINAARERISSSVRSDNGDGRKGCALALKASLRTSGAKLSPGFFVAANRVGSRPSRFR
jgi:hypothetical protein